LLQPYYKNFNKRLIKSPKLYFLDTGLVSFLLNIQNETQMATHPLKGALFESFIISETLKHRFNLGKTDNLYYFRDNIGNEVDLVCDHGVSVDAIEIKSSQTIASDHFKGLKYIMKITDSIRNSHIVYGGDQSYVMNNVNVVGWKQIHSNLNIYRN
jgi:predicted AAA+ superfamily ATPase